METERPSSLPAAVIQSAALLQRSAESVRAVMEMEDNRFSRALGDLQRLALNENIPIAIVGGLGAIRYGYPAATQDIDIAVGREDLEKLLRAAPRYGLRIAWEADTGWHTLAHTDVEINIVPEGGRAKKSAPTTIPGPVQLGVSRGLDYADLSGWMELKLSSGRQKDRAHIVEVMKKTDEPALAVARNHIAAIHPSYLQLFDDLLKEAREERAQEGERGGG